MADIHGLNHFAEYFSDVNEMFVIVGGVASSVLMGEAGQEFRPTKDIDLVIIANPSQPFTTRLKQYIADGGYEIQEKADGSPSFYRFRKPTSKDHPVQIEVFSNNADQIDLGSKQHIIPIKTDPAAGRLSAILLEEDYFQLIKNNRKVVGKHSVATEAAIIPLKARAYNDIKERGESESDAKKHRNDIMKLALNLEEGKSAKLADLPRTHMERYLADLAGLSASDFKNVMKGYAAKNVGEVIEILRSYFL
jgi:hypothetical protein